MSSPPTSTSTGWIKRGPTGVIGTNKSDAVETVHSLLADIADGAVVGRTAGSDELERLLAERGVTPLEMPDWHRIDAAEIELGHSHGRQRTTLAHRSELLAAAERTPISRVEVRWRTRSRQTPRLGVSLITSSEPV